MTGRVFVVQRPAHFSSAAGGWVNKYDISSAREHGELHYLLRPGNIYRDKLASALLRIEAELADFGAGDHLLAIGDPVAIAAAVMVAARNNAGSVSLLKFDRVSGRYEAYEVLVPNSGPRSSSPRDIVVPA